LIGRLADDFPRFSLAGQGCALELVADWVPLAGPEGIQATVRMLPLATRSADKEVRGRAVALAGLLAQQPMPAEMLAVCREVVRKGLQDAEPDNRVLAVQQATHAALDLLPQVAPLLDDPVPVVRRSAILAVGPAREAIATDDLLRSLHDTDEDVRRLCEAALKQTRGLSNSDVALGRLISDSRPGTRLQVLDSLRRPDLEPGIWLRQLSHDAVPAVRAAAVRAAGEQQQADLSARLWQMAQNDPSPTVRQLAQFYSGRKKLPPSDSRGP
jgi:HEAT repeat protein